MGIKTGTGAGRYIQNGGFVKNSFGTGDLIKVVTIAAGGLSGGISSTIAGGSFWAGARQGLITSGLNHVAHSTIQRIKYNSFLSEVDESIIKSGHNPDDPVADTSLKATSEFIFSLDVIKGIIGDGIHAIWGTEVTFFDPWNSKERYSGGEFSPAQSKAKIMKMGKLPDTFKLKNVNGVTFTHSTISIYDEAYSSYRNLALGIGAGLKYINYIHITMYYLHTERIEYKMSDLIYTAEIKAAEWHKRVSN